MDALHWTMPCAPTFKPSRRAPPTQLRREAHQLRLRAQRPVAINNEQLFDHLLRFASHRKVEALSAVNRVEYDDEMINFVKTPSPILLCHGLRTLRLFGCCRSFCLSSRMEEEDNHPIPMPVSPVLTKMALCDVQQDADVFSRLLAACHGIQVLDFILTVLAMAGSSRSICRTRASLLCLMTEYTLAQKCVLRSSMPLSSSGSAFVPISRSSSLYWQRKTQWNLFCLAG